MPTQQIIRLFIIAFVASCGLGLFSVNRAIADDCGCETACSECPSNSCESNSCESNPCGSNSCDRARECPLRRAPNYAYKALDAVAGGIEKLLRLNKLNCDGACDSGGCDDLICDDGCDAVTLEAFSIPSLPMHVEDQWHGNQSHGNQSQGNEWQGNQSQHNQWQGQPQAPRTEMRMSEPSVIEPHTLEPAVIDPRIQQGRPLSDPFRDDARVRTKRQVRRTIHQQPRNRSANNLSPKRTSNHRHSRNYKSSNPSARTVR